MVFQPFDDELNPQELRTILPMKLCNFKPNDSTIEMQLKADIMKEQGRILIFFQEHEGKAHFTMRDGYLEKRRV